MNLFVYSDESGVFDVVHNDFFVFGGLLFTSKERRDIAVRKYRNVERTMRNKGRYAPELELKAKNLENKHKGEIMRSLNSELKFAIIISQKSISPEIYSFKEHKQRYLDYAYKIGLKRFLQHLASRNIIAFNEVKRIYVWPDEHTTATSGRYELEEGLLNEFKIRIRTYFEDKFQLKVRTILKDYDPVNQLAGMIIITVEPVEEFFEKIFSKTT